MSWPAETVTVAPKRRAETKRSWTGVTIIASAPGFTDGTGTAEVVPPALSLSGITTPTTSFSANDPFVVSVGLPNATNTNLRLVQGARAGGSLTASVTHSNASVAQLTTLAGSAQTRSVTFQPDFSSTPASLAGGGIEFDPLAGGLTTVSATIPGFITTTAASLDVVVTSPEIDMFGVPATFNSEPIAKKINSPT